MPSQGQRQSWGSDSAVAPTSPQPPPWLPKARGGLESQSPRPIADIRGKYRKAHPPIPSGRARTAAQVPPVHTLGLRSGPHSDRSAASPSTAKASYPVTPELLYGSIPPDRNPWDSRFTVPHDFAGIPTIALPCGLNDDGMPVSIQFAGHHLSEPLLVGIGDAFESATDFHNLHPPV